MKSCNICMTSGMVAKFSPEKERLEQLQIDRNATYGDPYAGHVAVGKACTALIENHYGIVLPHAVPASLMAQMMVMVKMVRAAYGPGHQDNFDDAHVYVKFVEEFQKKELQDAKDSTDGSKHWPWSNHVSKVQGSGT